MKKLILISFIFVLTSLSSVSQDLKVKVNTPPIPYYGNVEWGNDFLVSSTEPLGRPSGGYRNSNSTIYVSVPDTNIQSGAAIVILSSADDGATWTNISALTPASVVPKTKMIRSATDSVYCFFQLGAAVYCWNVINNRVAQVRSVGYRDFDVAASSTGSMYIFFDTLGTNSIYRYGSSDGGVTWGQRGNVTSAGAFPRIYFSALGDTLSLNYYGPVLADTATSVIRHARYRETAPGTMATVGAFIDVTRSIAPKKEFASVRYGNNVWFFYTSEEGGNVDIRYKVSTNAGVSFPDSSRICPLCPPPFNIYWFDAKHHNRGLGGVDIIYYSATDIAHSPSGILTQMNYSTAATTSMLSFSTPVQFANHPPVTSATGYIPTLIEYYDGQKNAGVIWVGDDGGNAKLYFDRLLAFSTLNLTVNLEACSPIQDTITVLLRSASAPYNVVDSVRAYLSALGTASINFTNALDSVNYYIVVKHRNSIETWSKSGGEVFTAGVLNYDFTTAATQAFGNNMVNVGGEWSFYSGDVNQDGIVDGGDAAMIDNDAFNFVTGYVATDLNCDDVVDGTDAAFADNNAFNFVQVARP